MHIDGLDELDNRILEVIEKDARLSYSEIGERVGISRVSVKNRMEIMESKGIIKGYVTMIDPTSFPEGRRFFVDVITDPEHFEEVVSRFSHYEVLRKIYALTGESRFRAEGYAAGNAKYEMFVRNVKRHPEGIKSLTIQDVQFTIKDMDRGVDYVEKETPESE